MQEDIAPSPTAKKMLIIICNRLHIKMDRLKTLTSLEELGVSEAEKEHLVGEIADKFLIPREGRLLQKIQDGKYIKDTFHGHLKRITTIWNILEFIESNDGWNGKPAAYNLQ